MRNQKRRCARVCMCVLRRWLFSVARRETRARKIAETTVEKSERREKGGEKKREENGSTRLRRRESQRPAAVKQRR